MLHPLLQRALCSEPLLHHLSHSSQKRLGQSLRHVSHGLHLQPSGTAQSRSRHGIGTHARWMQLRNRKSNALCHSELSVVLAASYAHQQEEPVALNVNVMRAAAAAATLAGTIAWNIKPSGCRGVPVSCEEKYPIISRHEVSKHASRDTGVWVTYKDGVYDITEFIINHPGGTDKIMLAAGKAIDPFWRIYQQHEGRQNATELLSKMQIGRLDPSDLPPPVSSEDPYASDPDRHPGLLFHNTKPCNAELPPELALDSWITPNALWFIRHHHPVPMIDDKQYRLFVEGLGTKAISLDMEDLRTRFVPYEVTCTIQCGGNRRGEMNTVEKTSGIPWGSGAMSTATWKGALLRDVLTFSGLMTPYSAERDGVRHVIFEAVDGMQASIPIDKALSPYGDVVLAYEMNGEPLPPEHGFPVRLVVPGHVGVRNVKWVARLRTSCEEAAGPWQRGIAYKGFSPSVKSLAGFDEAAIEKIQSIQEQPVTSMIISPKEGALEEFDEVTVRGIAWSGGGRGIIRVDVSADGGKNWTTAELQEGADQHPTRAWAWTFWEAEVPMPEGSKAGDKIELCCKATDSAYNTQPEDPAHIWNLRGLNNNSWSKVHVLRKE